MNFSINLFFLPKLHSLLLEHLQSSVEGGNVDRRGLSSFEHNFVSPREIIEDVEINGLGEFWVTKLFSVVLVNKAIVVNGDKQSLFEEIEVHIGI